jgi:uncharacterized phage protein (predicted DNA packaging)
VKISEITIEHLKDYAHVTHDADNETFSTIFAASRSYIQSYTGLTLESLDLHEDITIALMILSNEMYENRVYMVEGTSVNKVVSTILNMHSTNLL